MHVASLLDCASAKIISTTTLNSVFRVSLVYDRECCVLIKYVSWSGQVSVSLSVYIRSYAFVQRGRGRVEEYFRSVVRTCVIATGPSDTPTLYLFIYYIIINIIIIIIIISSSSRMTRIREKCTPRQIYSRGKLTYADFTLPTSERLPPPNTPELLPRELHSPWTERAEPGWV